MEKEKIRSECATKPLAAVIEMLIEERVKSRQLAADLAQAKQDKGF